MIINDKIESSDDEFDCEPSFIYMIRWKGFRFDKDYFSRDIYTSITCYQFPMWKQLFRDMIILTTKVCLDCKIGTGI